MATMTIRSSRWVLLDPLSIGDRRVGIHSDATVVKMEDGCMDQCKSMKIIVLIMGISATYHSYKRRATDRIQPHDIPCRWVVRESGYGDDMTIKIDNMLQYDHKIISYKMMLLGKMLYY